MVYSESHKKGNTRIWREVRNKAYTQFILYLMATVLIALQPFLTPYITSNFFDINFKNFSPYKLYQNYFQQQTFKTNWQFKINISLQSFLRSYPEVAKLIASISAARRYNSKQVSFLRPLIIFLDRNANALALLRWMNISLAIYIKYVMSRQINVKCNTSF